MQPKQFLYHDFMSLKFRDYLWQKGNEVYEIKGLKLIGNPGGLETKESFEFLLKIYHELRDDLALVLEQRRIDRNFIDRRTISCKTYNKNLKTEFLSSEYKTLLGEVDSEGRIVIGPKSPNYTKSNQKDIAPLPDYLKGYHVTLFGPPDSEKMCINAMNAFHRKLSGEPEIISKLLEKVEERPKWGADNEDSKTPLHEDFVSAGVNLTKALNHKLEFDDGKKSYRLEKEYLSHPIKRFPGLALPSYFLFYNEEPLPLHLYDFALHVFENWHNPEALVFYVPKLEHDEEARYIKKLIRKTEELICEKHPEYKMGTIRLMIVLENPRAVFRVNEIIDELYPYFAGASLGWHDYLASTARVFKNDPNYRIPVKADPDIVIKYIKASHNLLSDVVGKRGGIKVGGMYGILPSEYNLESPSLQVTLVGYFRDVITQLKRNLNGFWVAHPDFVRIGMALIEAWKLRLKGDDKPLASLITSLLDKKYHNEILKFVKSDDIEGLNPSDPLYARSLLVADVGESNIIPNNRPDEIRYNVFQTLQYLTDWLCGNGCVALPTVINNIPVRVMDDLATCERSRWEVWHEIHHERFSKEEFLKIAFEEMNFIRRGYATDKKITQVKWSENNSKWYEVAFKIMIKLMTDPKPVEFATELLLPFTIGEVRESDNPWRKIQEIERKKFRLDENIERFSYYFELCGDLSFAMQMSKKLVVQVDDIKKSILNFNLNQVLGAASFHGDIGHKKNLDSMAKKEQSKVEDEEEIINELQNLGKKYLDKFGFKFLISASGRTGVEMLEVLKSRYQRSQEEELDAAKEALAEITIKRLREYPANSINAHLESLRGSFKVMGLQVALTFDSKNIQTLCYGTKDGKISVDENSFFEIASLSKTIGSAIALEVFKKNNIPLNSSVDTLLKECGSSFTLGNKKVQLVHLMNHTALNMHYVNGVPLSEEMPRIDELLNGSKEWGYEAIKVINEPGSVFHYSGAGFLLIEHLLEKIEKKKFSDLLKSFLDSPNLKLSESENYAYGFKDNGEMIQSTRLQFPAIAAGMMGTAQGVLDFLCQLGDSFHDLRANAPISHDTAVRMLEGKDLGAKSFMNCLIGLGVFIAEAGENRFMIHQGANDGYRSLYLYCFKGPDRGKGFTLFANGELQAVQLIARASQILLKEMSFSGINFNHFDAISSFKSDGLLQEEVVNQGYKQLVFDAFIDDLPEKIIRENQKDPLLDYNLLVGSTIIGCSNQKFARAENLISPFLPEFDADAYGRQGKIMDSWESERHNNKEFEYLHLKLNKISDISYVSFCTKYHDGNQVEKVSIDALIKGEWVNLLSPTKLEGHSYKKIKLSKVFKRVEEVKINAYPDGGLTRVGLYHKLPSDSDFVDQDDACIRYKEIIPSAHGALKLTYNPSKIEVEKNLAKVSKGELFDLASKAYGAKIESASNEHYGPAERVIFPYGPIDMFDGLESARSRKKGNYEEVVIILAMESAIEEIILDFTFFVNNNPREIEIFAFDKDWEVLIPRDNVKAFRSNKKLYSIKNSRKFTKIKLRTYPDGGMNRIHILGRK